MCFRYALYDGVKTGSEDGSPLAPLMGEFTDYDGGVTSTHFGPASFFVAYADHGVIYRFMPLTVSTSAMEVIWLVRGDAREGVDYDRDKLTWLWRVTSEADKRITEDNQAGVNSRYYTPGPYAPMESNAKRYIAWYLGRGGKGRNGKEVTRFCYAAFRTCTSTFSPAALSMLMRASISNKDILPRIRSERRGWVTPSAAAASA